MKRILNAYCYCNLQTTGTCMQLCELPLILDYSILDHLKKKTQVYLLLITKTKENIDKLVLCTVLVLKLVWREIDVLRPGAQIIGFFFLSFLTATQQ